MRALGRTLVTLLVLGAVLGGGVILWGRGWPGEPRAAEPGPEPGAWPSRIAANGVVEGARPEIAIRPEVVGTIIALPARENRSVARGDVLVELDGAAAKERVHLADGEVEAARADLLRLRNGERTETRTARAAAERAKHVAYQQAKAEYDRIERLFLSRATSAEVRDAAQFRLQQAQAEWAQAQAERALAEAPARADEEAAAQARVKVAEAKLRLAREELAKTRVTAPCAGLVLQVLAETGEVGGPASPRPVLILADLSRRRVRAFVEELDAARVRPGQEAAVLADGLPGREFRARVAEAMPRMGRRTPLTDEPAEYRDLYFREVLLDLEAADELPLNLRVRVLIRAGDPGP